MKTDISGAVKNILQVRANLKSQLSEKESEQNLAVSFMDLMKQNSVPNTNVSADSGQTQFRPEAGGSSNTAYDASKAPAKNVSVKEEVTPEEMQTKAEGSLESFEEEIRDILKEELGVTEEEIAEAMESLGMSFLDLRNLQNLTSLVQALTGEDIGALFSSEAFQNVMEQVTAVTDALCAELGITKEELNELCEAWDQMKQVEGADVESESEVQKPQEQPSVEENVSDVTEKKVAIEAAPKEEPVVSPKEEPVTREEAREVLETVKSPEKTASDTEKGGSFSEQGLLDHSKDAMPDMTNAGTVFTEQQTIKTEEFILPQEAPQPYANQADAVDFIEQIAKNVRVTVSGNMSSMEMQLNPEHLGKLYLNVTEREGIVRAQIATQNTVVKEALETQLVELRQSLNQQGIKVDAIEVTVSTHEFEQNLEENARQEEQAKRQMEESGKQTRRNLNLNDLDGLTGLMSEEEQLAAQIMRDNGNQVDLTA